MDTTRRHVPILGRPTGNILSRKALKKAQQRHAAALQSAKASTDNSVPKSMTMKHLKLRLNTRSQRVRKFQVVMDDNERMLERYVACGPLCHLQAASPCFFSPWITAQLPPRCVAPL
jgi:hypothetical protein